MTVAKGIVYGETDGYLVTLYEGMGTKSVYVNLDLGGEGGDVRRYRISEFLKEAQRKSRIAKYDVQPDGIAVDLVDSAGIRKRYPEFIDLLVGFLRQEGYTGAEVCSACGMTLSPGGFNLIREGLHVKKLCRSCVSAREMREVPQLDEVPEPNRIIAPTVGAVLGMAVGAIPWALVSMFGFFVGWLGFIMGLSIRKGYELFGGKPGRYKLFLIILLSIVGVVFAELLGSVASVYRELAKEGINSLKYSIDFVIYVVRYEPEIRGRLIGNTAFGMLFAMLGIFGLIRDTKQEYKSKKFEILS